MSYAREEKLLSQRIFVGTQKDILYKVKSLLGKGGAVSTVNPIMLSEAMQNPELAASLRNSLNIPDGIGIARAFSKRGVHTEILPGVELGEELAKIPNISLALIGGEAGVCEAAAEALKAKNPTLRVCFTSSGFGYSKQEIKRHLKECTPDIAYVCLGSPKQEILIQSLLKSSPKTVFLGLGGSLDIYSGKLSRAPKIYRKLYLEWLYRMIKEPRRIKKIPKILDFLVYDFLERRRIYKRKLPKFSKKARKS